MIATWFGGPFDGRSDQLPDGCHTVSLALPSNWARMDEWLPTGYVEVKCHVVNTAHGWLIVWHEP